MVKFKFSLKYNRKSLLVQYLHMVLLVAPNICFGPEDGEGLAGEYQLPGDANEDENQPG
jgi:hypothetical protein